MSKNHLLETASEVEALINQPGVCVAFAGSKDTLSGYGSVFPEKLAKRIAAEAPAANMVAVDSTLLAKMLSRTVDFGNVLIFRNGALWWGSKAESERGMEAVFDLLKDLFLAKVFGGLNYLKEKQRALADEVLKELNAALAG